MDFYFVDFLRLVGKCDRDGRGSGFLAGDFSGLIDCCNFFGRSLYGLDLAAYLIGLFYFQGQGFCGRLRF